MLNGRTKRVRSRTLFLALYVGSVTFLDVRTYAKICKRPPRFLPTLIRYLDVTAAEDVEGGSLDEIDMDMRAPLSKRLRVGNFQDRAVGFSGTRCGDLVAAMTCGRGRPSSSRLV